MLETELQACYLETCAVLNDLIRRASGVEQRSESCGVYTESIDCVTPDECQDGCHISEHQLGRSPRLIGPALVDPLDILAIIARKAALLHFGTANLGTFH